MMRWDSVLAAKAQNWANKCTFRHSYTGVGENLYSSSFSGRFSRDFRESDVGIEAVEVWASERNNIIGTYGLFPYTSMGGQIGHWTQMIWADSYKVISK